MADPGDHTGWRRSAARRAMLPVAIALIGTVGPSSPSEGTLRIIGGGVIAVAITVAVALVFLEIGYSEDRARARDSTDPPGR